MRHLGMGLALLLLATQAAAEPEKGKTVRGSRTTLKMAPYAPYRIGGVWRDVKGPIELAGVAFPTRIEGEKLLVSEGPDGEPKRKVRSGATMRFAWPVGKKKRVEKLHFSRKTGTWRYHIAEVVKFKLGRSALALVDADADGVHGEFEEDGLLFGHTLHAIPLRKQMLIGLEEVKFLEITPDGSSVRCEREPLQGPKPQLLVLKFLNYLRRLHGFSPVRLDPELSRGCTEHAEYLAGRAWDGGGDPHEQDKTDPRASDEGATAAGVSVVAKMPPIASLRAHYITWYHRFGMMHPRLTRVGINATQPELTVIDVWRGRVKGEAGAKLHDRPWFCPADGVIGLPPYAGPEIPREPVADLGSRGFPLMVYFPQAGGEITKFKGALFAGRRSKTPVEVLIVKPDKKGIAGVVPAARLNPNSWYRVLYSWTRGGKDHTQLIRFRTK